MKDAPLFSVIVPVFNNWELTRNCLASLKEHTPGADYEVIVADNGSGDATATELAPLGQALFGPRFTRLRFEENRNFGPACNAGAKAADAPFLFFLNNDTLLTPGWPAPLLAAFEQDPALGAAGPLLLYEDDTVQHLGVAFGLGTANHLYRGFPKTHQAAVKPRAFQALTAAALMLPRSLFLDLDGFYEGFINGFEDVDLCLRLGRRGKSLRCLPDSVLYHLESRTTGRKTHEEHNSRLFWERQGDHVVPDWHRYGHSDGFLPFISDALDVRLLLKPEDEAALLRESRGDALAVHDLCQANPFWLAGREILVNLLRRQGDLETALVFAAQSTDLRDSADSFERLEQLCREAGQEEAAVRVSKEAAIRRANRRDANGIRILQRRYQDKGDAHLDSLFRQYCESLRQEHH